MCTEIRYELEVYYCSRIKTDRTCRSDTCWLLHDWGKVLLYVRNLLQKKRRTIQHGIYDTTFLIVMNLWLLYINYVVRDVLFHYSLPSLVFIICLRVCICVYTLYKCRHTHIYIYTYLYEYCFNPLLWVPLMTEVKTLTITRILTINNDERRWQVKHKGKESRS